MAAAPCGGSGHDGGFPFQAGVVPAAAYCKALTKRAVGNVSTLQLSWSTVSFVGVFLGFLEAAGLAARGSGRVPCCSSDFPAHLEQNPAPVLQGLVC